VGIGTATPAAKLDIQGTINLSGKLTAPNGASMPLAYGFINSNGSFSVGTSNVSSLFNATSNWYEITITGVSYFFASFVTVVSPSPPSNTVLIPSVGGVSGNLILRGFCYIDGFGEWAAAHYGHQQYGFGRQRLAEQQ
jgi:hypothetical protein